MRARVCRLRQMPVHPPRVTCHTRTRTHCHTYTPMALPRLAQPLVRRLLARSVTAASRLLRRRLGRSVAVAVAVRVQVAVAVVTVRVAAAVVAAAVVVVAVVVVAVVVAGVG